MEIDADTTYVGFGKSAGDGDNAAEVGDGDERDAGATAILESCEDLIVYSPSTRTLEFTYTSC